MQSAPAVYALSEIGVSIAAPAELRERVEAILSADPNAPSFALSTSESDVVVIAEPSADAALAVLEATAQTAPEALTIVLHDELSARDVRALLKAQVRGFVTNDRAQQALGPTIRAVVAGQMVLPAEYHRRLDRPNLTMREKQILGMIVLGFSNAEIARKLYLSESTVKSHLSASFAKLGVRSRKDAAALILDPASPIGAGILSIAPKPAS
jgi:DNA-binding NarL/FixJ family response regulator